MKAELEGLLWPLATVSGSARSPRDCVPARCRRGATSWNLSRCTVAGSADLFCTWISTSSSTKSQPYSSGSCVCEQACRNTATSMPLADSAGPSFATGGSHRRAAPRPARRRRLRGRTPDDERHAKPRACDVPTRNPPVAAVGRLGSCCAIGKDSRSVRENFPSLRWRALAFAGSSKRSCCRR